jgi:hypothetical protein
MKMVSLNGLLVFHVKTGVVNWIAQAKIKKMKDMGTA